MEKTAESKQKKTMISPTRGEREKGESTGNILERFGLGERNPQDGRAFKGGGASFGT